MRLCTTLLPALAFAPLVAQDGHEGVRFYGSATPGTGGVAPVLWVTTTPRPGLPTFALTIDTGKPNAVSASYLSAAPQSFDLGGVRVLIDFSQSLLLGFRNLDGNGSAVIAGGIPNNPNLIDQVLFAQTFVADSGGAPLGFSASRGVRLRIKRTALLFGAGSDQAVIDLASGQVTKFGASIGTGYDVSLATTGTHIVIPHVSSPTKATELFDVTQNPPASGGTFSPAVSTHLPQFATFHPDGLRLYVTNNGPANSNPTIDVVWALPSQYGKPYIGTNQIPMGTVLDPMKMLFTSDGALGYLGILGLFGGGAEIRQYDTNPASASYNKQVKNVQWTAEFGFSFDVSPDDTMLATATAMLGQNSVTRLLHLPGLTPAKLTPGLPLGRVVNDMEFDPSGRYLYVANGNHVLRALVDLADPNFGTHTKYDSGLNTSWTVDSIAVSDAGDRLYVCASGNVLEYDVPTRNLLRTFASTGTSRIVFR